MICLTHDSAAFLDYYRNNQLARISIPAQFHSDLAAACGCLALLLIHLKPAGDVQSLSGDVCAMITRQERHHLRDFTRIGSSRE
jgi:hypothetical protein